MNDSEEKNSLRGGAITLTVKCISCNIVKMNEQMNVSVHAAWSDCHAIWQNNDCNEKSSERNLVMLKNSLSKFVLMRNNWSAYFES